MEIEIIEDLTGLSVEDLNSNSTQAREAFNSLVAAEAPTEEQVQNAESLAEYIDRIDAELAARTAAAQALADRAAALRTRFSTDEAEVVEGDEAAADEDGEEDAAAEEEEADEEPAEEAAAEEAAEAVTAATKTIKVPTVKKVAAAVKRPPVPAESSRRLTITAAADVPEFATGSKIEDLATLAKATLNRMQGFTPPSGNGETEDLRYFGVATFRKEFPKELIADRADEQHTQEVLEYAASEKRLPGGSLVASNGWCAPSEQLYDFCVTEEIDGILSLPEVQAPRGGIKYTTGIDFNTIYAGVGFSQTEAQAIAGTTKTCYEVPCPTFTEVRLDAQGLCIKVPILLNSAYPEMTQRIISGSLVAHQYKINAKMLAAVETAAGAARTMKDFSTTAGSTFSAIELLIDQLRQKYRMSLSASMEVVLPYWVKGALRNDYSMRTGIDLAAVTDAMIVEQFTVRKANVQFVYSWQELTVTDVAYPTTFKMLVYPSGTFVKLTKDVINLSAVYDAASLATNIYTGLFMEEGVALAQMCNNAVLATIPVCNSGRTGIANVSQCNVLP